MRTAAKSFFVLLLAIQGHQLAIGQTAAPMPAAPMPPSATETIVQMQIQAPATGPSRMSGAEADAIYKRYIEHIGHPMVQTQSAASSSTGGSQPTANPGASYQ